VTSSLSTQGPVGWIILPIVIGIAALTALLAYSLPVASWSAGATINARAFRSGEPVAWPIEAAENVLVPRLLIN
jgi:hypothetical protein